MQPDWMKAAVAEAAKQPVIQSNTLIPETVPGRVFHLDGDYLAYFAAGHDDTPPGIAVRIAAQRIENYRIMSGSEVVNVHLTASASDKGERGLISTVQPYQANRTGAKRPKNWDALREYLETSNRVAFERTIWTDREADDGMALASRSTSDPVRYVVVGTRDKDMRMFAGTHMDWMTYTTVAVPPGAYDVVCPLTGLQYGHKFFWMQMLMGDNADHIPGLPKLYGNNVGPARAAEYLAKTRNNSEAFKLVREAYRAHYSETWDDRMAEQAALLWMRDTTEPDITGFLAVCPVINAAQRLKERVSKQRAEIDKLNAKAHATSYVGRAKEYLTADW